MSSMKIPPTQTKAGDCVCLRSVMLPTDLRDHFAGTDATGPAVGCPIDGAPSFKIAEIGCTQCLRAFGGDQFARDAVNDGCKAFAYFTLNLKDRLNILADSLFARRDNGDD